MIKGNTIIEIIAKRAELYPDEIAIKFSGLSLAEDILIDNQTFHKKIMGFAAYLQSKYPPKTRALLIHPQGIDFIISFFGCLAAKLIAIPLYPPGIKDYTRIIHIIDDATPSLAIGHIEDLIKNTGFIEILNAKKIKLEGLNFEESVENSWKLNPEAIAFLQYTSGSTNLPKGVMVNHQNLIHNSELTRKSFDMDRDSCMVSWLPFYHDMGLIGGIVQPIYGGYRASLMSPMTFLKKPLKWLQSISDEKDASVVSGAPNFAYDICFNKIADTDIESLNLSNWKIAYSGAEPVRMKTMQDFSAKFSPFGFKHSNFFPVYGMAEATLLISAGITQTPPQSAVINIKSINQNNAIDTENLSSDSNIEVVNCGYKTQNLLIVDPNTRIALPENKIGEIWLNGPSVAKGYWNKEKETQESFKATLSDGSTTEFLRTGDLGFLRDNQVYITGRLKDIIIIRGANYYPQDLESSVYELNEPFVKNGGVAFSMRNHTGEDQLVIIQEIKRHSEEPLFEMQSKIRKQISQRFSLQVNEVVLVKASSIPKTSSGKLRRQTTKQMYIHNQLSTIF